MRGLIGRRELDFVSVALELLLVASLKCFGKRKVVVTVVLTLATATIVGPKYELSSTLTSSNVTLCLTEASFPLLCIAKIDGF